MSRNLDVLARRVIRLAAKKGLTVGTAESLTGGMVAASLAGVAGASQVLFGGIISYAPRTKHELLDVSWEIIDGAGVVSETCARQMALGAKARLGVDTAVSCTGLAGPDGGTPQIQIGTVFLGRAGKDGLQVEKMHFTGGRKQVRRKTAAAALHILWDEINNW